jgi:hypothetical protein
MPIRVEAIIPRGAVPLDPARVQSGVDRWLRDFAFAVQSEMADYPPWRPWRRPPRSGPRRGGRRTGGYGRGWTLAARFTPNSVTLVNPVTYAVFVGGPRRGNRGERQARAMAARGWKSISDVAPAIARRLRPVLIRRITGS